MIPTDSNTIIFTHEPGTFGGPRVRVELEGPVDLDELLETFKCFLISVGYALDYNDTIELRREHEEE